VGRNDKSVRSVVAFIFLFLFSLSSYAVDINIAVGRGPSTLDPIKATDAASIRLLRMVAPGLIDLDSEFKPTSQFLDLFGHKKYQKFYIELKPKVFFDDGTPLTLEFIKSYFERILDEEEASPLRGAFKDVERIDIQGKRLTFYLKKPNPFFWGSLEVSIARFDSEKSDFPIGLGIYKITHFSDYGDVTLSRLDGFHNLHFHVIKDPVVRYLKLERGEIDIIHNDIGEEILEYGLENRFKVIESPSTSYTYIGFLMNDGKTADFRVRKALSYAIHHAEIVKHLLGGRAKPAHSLLSTDHLAHYNSDIHTYNPKKSSQILDDAGYEKNEEGVRFTLRLAITSNPFIQRLAQVIQQDLKEVGIDVDISSSEWGTFYGNIKTGNFESYILTWVGRFQSDIYYTLFHSSMMPPNGANRGRYSSETMDKLLNSMMTEASDEKRHKLVKLIQKWQEQDMIYIPLWKRSHVALINPNIQDYFMPKDGGYEGLVYTTK
jgi:peptide/nickel transport system substrate-binding protein